MSWLPPLSANAWLSSPDSNSFRSCPKDTLIVPLPPHPGAFGVHRAHHIHEGVDLYAPEGTPVLAVEDGIVVALEWFTGPRAGSPWWRDTQAVLVEGASGVVVYGEIIPHADCVMGRSLLAGQVVGAVTQVLQVDKGRPMTMLHLELHASGTRSTQAWEPSQVKPLSLQDPTFHLLTAVGLSAP